MQYWRQEPAILFQFVTIVMMVLSLPLAIFAFAFSPPSTEADTVIMAIAIGLNTFIWANFVTESLRFIKQLNLVDKQTDENTSD